MKRIVAITLAVLIILSTIAVGITVANAASGATLTYTFAGSEAAKPGFAEGTISLKVTSSADAGNYYLYWADNTKALDGYRYVATMNVANGATGTYKMLDHTAIPPKATQLIAIKSSTVPTNKNVSNAQATYTIPSHKKLSDTTTLYTFGAFSDPQIANDSYGDSRYPHDEKHWAKALETFANRNVEFLVSSGDTVNDQNGDVTYAAEYQAYQRILANSSYANPIWECNGNHDVHVNWQGGAAQLNKPFVMGTGVDSTAATIKANRPYFEMTEPKTGDHFIFMAQEGGFYTNQKDQFTTAQLDWLEGLLKKYSKDGKNIFIMEHANVEGWGSGDKATAPFYYDLGLKKSQASTARFIKLMETYKECVIVTGHTHLELSAHLNFSDNNGTSAVMMHNSAIGGVRRLVNGSVNRDPVLGMSEGYLVDVYEDCIIFNGANLYNNEIMPDCTYIIPFNTTSNGELPTEQPTSTPTPTNPPVTPTNPPVTPTNPSDDKVTEGYYLVGSLNGSKLWDAATLTADRKLKANPNGSGDYYLEWTFYAGDELKVVHYNGTSIDKWFNDGGDNYKIGAGTNKVGDCTIFFNPNGKSTWSYQWFTVQPGDSGIVEPTVAPTAKPTNPPTNPPTEKPTAKPTNPPTNPPTEKPTAKPTNPPTNPPTEKPTAKPTNPPTEKPTNAPYLMYGDVNISFDVTITDATVLQRFLAKKEMLYDEQLTNAEVTGEGEITVIDATTIQRYVAKIIDLFPIEKKSSKSIAMTSANDVATLLATAKSELSTYYQYASFDQYMALKKVANELTKSGDKSQTAYNKLNNAYTNFHAILEAIGVSAGGTIDVYFKDMNNWSTVNAYIWPPEKAKWPGEAMTYIKTDAQGKKIYRISIEAGTYTNIIFNNGSTQTVDLALSNTKNECFYTTTMSGGKYLCDTYTYTG